MSTAAAGATAAMTRAGGCIGTSDTLNALFLLLADIQNSRAKDQDHDCNNDKVLHRYQLLFQRILGGQLPVCAFAQIDNDTSDDGGGDQTG